MRCQNCNYPIFQYARCCPLCGQAVETQVITLVRSAGPQTRIEFWLANLWRTIKQTKLWRAIAL